MRSPKWPGSHLNFQVNRIMVVSSGRTIPLSGTKTSRPADHKVVGTRSKNIASGSPGVIVSGAIPRSTPWFLDPWIQATGEIAAQSGSWFRAYPAFWRALTQPHKFLQGITPCYPESSKGHSVKTVAGVCSWYACDAGWGTGTVSLTSRKQTASSGPDGRGRRKRCWPQQWPQTGYQGCANVTHYWVSRGLDCLPIPQDMALGGHTDGMVLTVPRGGDIATILGSQ